ncbi:MAG: DUF1059 domain-containing protein [Acidimicrobiales bacterium]
MPEFKCGSPACKSKFSARTQQELMAAVNEHVRREHAIPVPTKSIMNFLEVAAVTKD